MQNQRGAFRRGTGKSPTTWDRSKEEMEASDMETKPNIQLSATTSDILRFKFLDNIDLFSLFCNTTFWQLFELLFSCFIFIFTILYKSQNLLVYWLAGRLPFQEIWGTSNLISIRLGRQLPLGNFPFWWSPNKKNI